MRVSICEKESFSTLLGAPLASSNARSPTGGRLGGRRHVLMALTRLRGLTTKEKPDRNLRDFSKLRPGLITLS